MNLKDIEQQVADLDTSPGPDFLFDLLRAYGLPKAGISRLRSGSYDKSDRDDEHLWKHKVYYRSADCDDEELYTAIDAASLEDRILRTPQPSVRVVDVVHPSSGRAR